MISLYLSLLIIFPVIAIWGIKKNESANNDLNITLLDKYDSKYLRGVSALFVLFGHLFTFVSEAGVGINKYIMFLAGQLGGIGVLVFFFVSGYGVYASYKQKTPTFDYVIKRVRGVYIPYLIIKFFFLIIAIIRDPSMDILKSVVNILLVEDWFINVILIKYLVYYVFWKFPKVKFFIFTFASDLILTIIYIYLGKPERWFNALWLFTFGMLFFELKSYINKFYSSKILIKSFLMFGLFAVVGFVFSKFKGAMWASPIKPIAGVFLCLGIVGILKLVKFNSKIICAVGDRSLFVYIVHLSIWFALGMDNQIIKYWVVIISTIVIVEILYRLTNLLNKPKRGA